MYPQHPSDGLVISGSIRISPPLTGDEAELLAAIATASFRSVLTDAPSRVVERLAPGHPAGPSGWMACPDGCCLDLDAGGLMLVEAIEPWLTYIVTDLLADHDFNGALMLWDCAERTFTALTVEGPRVRRRAVLRPRGAEQSRSRSAPSSAQRLQSV